VLRKLMEGPQRSSELRTAFGLSKPNLRTVLSRLRDDGWDIHTTRDTGPDQDPKYELLTPFQVGAKF